MLRSDAFDPPGVRLSVETSLRGLRVERVDLLLLHDCGLPSLERPDFVALLDRLREEGKIGAWGIAADASVVFEALARRAGLSAVQFASSAWRRRATRLPPGTAPPCSRIPRSGRDSPNCAVCSRRTTRWRAWSGHLGVDARDRDAPAALFLSLAVRDNPEGLVLFSSSRLGAIRSNVARVGAVSDGALDALVSLAADDAGAASSLPQGVRA